jgi:hypothetical protein
VVAGCQIRPKYDGLRHLLLKEEKTTHQPNFLNKQETGTFFCDQIAGSV